MAGRLARAVKISKLLSKDHRIADKTSGTMKGFCYDSGN